MELWRILPCDLKNLMQHVVGACDVISIASRSSSSTHVGRDTQMDPSPPPSPSTTLTTDISSTSHSPPPCYKNNIIKQ